jgi:hypothetical protein
MVSKLNPVQRSVTVEWYERGETKGKEVELDMLLALNPDLLHTNRQSFVVPPPATTIQAPINLQRVSVLLFFFYFFLRRNFPSETKIFLVLVICRSEIMGFHG